MLMSMEKIWPSSKSSKNPTLPDSFDAVESLMIATNLNRDLAPVDFRAFSWEYLRWVTFSKAFSSHVKEI